MLNINPFRQKPGYCGPASLKMVLGFFGIKITEKKLVEISGCTKSRGIGAEGLVRAAQELGFRAKIKDFSDLNRSFDKVSGPQEVEAVKDLLRRFPGPYRLAIDFHETDTHMPRGEDLSVENNPAGFYMYETTRTGRPVLGPVIIRGIRKSGHPVSRRRSIYGAECRNGLIYSTPPENPDYPALPEFNGTLDWYLLKNGHTDHFLATETPTAWPLKRRIAVQKKALAHALTHIKKEK